MDEWDYSEAAADYDARPTYAEAALSACFDEMGLEAGDRTCDIGAGTGRLTLLLLARGFDVVAVEPNAAMRARGVATTRGVGTASWIGGRAEVLPIQDACCRLVSFGSSFNVVDRDRALMEARRVLEPGGRLLCISNHRDLEDPLQRRIESVIRGRLPDYAYGTRREDQTPVIARSGLFGRIRRLEARCVHRLPLATWLQAWRSHLTLRRQAGPRFDEVLTAISAAVATESGQEISVPYVTRAWIAERM